MRRLWLTKKQTNEANLMVAVGSGGFKALLMPPDYDNRQFLADAMPVDDELANLVETAYLQGQIDGETQALAFAWLQRNAIKEH